MEAIIFCGVQASGKSTFYKQYFFNSHLRISLDLLNTRYKESLFINTALQVQQKVVIDNTNPSRMDREKYIKIFKDKKYRVIGYYFQSHIDDCIRRNKLREGKERIVDKGLYATQKRLEKPEYIEGFDELYIVEIKGNSYNIKPNKDEI